MSSFYFFILKINLRFKRQRGGVRILRPFYISGPGTRFRLLYAFYISDPGTRTLYRSGYYIPFKPKVRVLEPFYISGSGTLTLLHLRSGYGLLEPLFTPGSGTFTLLHLRFLRSGF